MNTIARNPLLLIVIGVVLYIVGGYYVFVGLFAIILILIGFIQEMRIILKHGKSTRKK